MIDDPRPTMRQRLRRARASMVVVLVSILLALLVRAWIGSFDPRPWTANLLGLVAFVPLGAPAGLLVYATLRHGDPYRRY